MFKEPTDNRLQVRVNLDKKIEFLKLANTLKLTEPELFVLLIDNSLLLEVDNIKFFRKTLRQRVRKGIGRTFLNELLKLKDDLNTYTKLL